MISRGAFFNYELGIRNYELGDGIYPRMGRDGGEAGATNRLTF